MPSQKKQRRVPVRLQHVPPEYFRNDFSRMLSESPKTQIPSISQEQLFQAAVAMPVEETAYEDKNGPDGYLELDIDASQYPSNPTTQEPLTSACQMQASDFYQGTVIKTMNENLEDPHESQMGLETSMHQHYGRAYPAYPPNNYVADTEFISPNHAVPYQHWDPRYFSSHPTNDPFSYFVNDSSSYPVNNTSNTSATGSSTTENLQYSKDGHDYLLDSSWLNKNIGHE